MVNLRCGSLAYIDFVFQFVGCITGLNATAEAGFQGHEVAGYPFLRVSSLSGKVQIEVKYSEQFDGLSAPYSDGPFQFSVSLSNTYRVETFEITGPGLISAFLLQGGLRWQSIRLLTNGTVTFSAIGLNASISTVDVQVLPGSFSCDNHLLNDVWNLGARTVGADCVEKGSQQALWEVSNKGALVRGMRPGVSADATATQLSDYTLQFDVNIQRAGMGWTVAMPLQYPNTGIQLGIVGNLPHATTLVNTNTTLTLKNSITLGYGYSLVNQTTLPSYHLDTFSLPVPVKEQTWHTITTILTSDQHLAVMVDKNMVFNVSLSKDWIGGSSIPTAGSFGFGGWQDQSAYVKNVIIRDSATSARLYSNPMTNPSVVLSEYGVHENFASVCLDGAKRDRLVWLGDFYHTSQFIGASTSRYDLIKGTLEYFLDWQISAGLIPINSPMGYDHTLAEKAFTLGDGGLSSFQTLSVALPDYQILGLISFTNYVYESNDPTWTNNTWSQWQAQVSWIMSQINSTTSLLSLQGQIFLGGGNGGSTINCPFLHALNRMAIVAKAVDDTPSAARYQILSASLGIAINQRLWNAKLGAYSLSLDFLNEYDLAGNSFCIISGLVNTSQTTQIIHTMQMLKLSPGYKDSSLVNSSDPTVNISPFTNSFFLHALLLSSQSSTTVPSISQPNPATTALNLLTSLWGAMLADNKTSTGTTWEYVSQTNQPGLDLFTSSSASWAGAPTYLLSRYVGGIHAKEGVEGFRYGNFVVDFSPGLGMGLLRGNARVVVDGGNGGVVSVQWNVVQKTGGKAVDVVVYAPIGTQGFWC